MNIKLFIFLYKIQRHAEAIIEGKEGISSYRKRALWALICGFARAGVLVMS